MVINFDNIQGNIVAGFNTDYQEFLALKRKENADIQVVGDWLASLADQITSTKRVKDERPLMKDPTTAEGMSWLFVALSKDILNALRPDAVYTSPALFNGFINRARSVMGDTTKPDDWLVGGTDTEVDILLIVAGNHLDTVRARTDGVVEAADTVGLIQSYRELGIRRIGDTEHFGFKDGISQPKIDLGDGTGGLPPGQFVFGYENSDNQVTSAIFSGAPDLSVDGSLMVFRRLRQDVQAFRDFCNSETERLRSRWPDLKTEHLAALVVGRWPDGELVSAQVNQPSDIPGSCNDFDFSDDTQGVGCPFAAHIRKVNPRLGGGDVVDPERRRFLRRGIPFGRPIEEEPDDDRGLLFVAFQTNIDDQVDFVTRTWMNSRTTPNIGNDLLVGRIAKSETGTLKIVRNGETFEVVSEENAWVTPNGGVYLFAPSIRGLKLLNQSPEGSVVWRARAALGRIRNVMVNIFPN
jgi:Dyp-type peroxidase family